MLGATGPGMLAGVRVIEIADETGEYCGLLLAGLGAEVIKIEPPGGATTRAIAPFLDDVPGPDRSLHFWHYNRGKRSVCLDLTTADGQADLHRLLDSADVLLEAGSVVIGRDAVAKTYPRLVHGRITPFGDDGPWAGFKGSDLVHLALGGVMMNCGYDPDPKMHFDMPPIAPQSWHAYHIAGEQMAVGIVAALLHRIATGAGQDVSCAVHEAVAKNTELDVMSWVMRHAPLYRMTSRHAGENRSHTPNISHTKDGRWYITYGIGARDQANLVPFLEGWGMQADLQRPDLSKDTKARNIPGAGAKDEHSSHILDVIQRFVRAFRYDDMPWREAQDAGLLWAPVRKPHENAEDPHWLTRGSFADVHHPEHGRSFRYTTSKWLSTATSWQTGRRAPLVGEDTAAILAQPRRVTVAPQPKPVANPILSRHGKPFPLQGVRIFDFAWFLASAGGTRYLAALGAESIKVEWHENPDTRLAAMAPVGGREARRAATGPLKGVTDSDMGGQFNNKNSGKRGMSLNIRHPKGLQIAKDLIRQSDVVAEGFSPGVLERLGLGYDVLKSIRPDIIYIQQSGMGSHGTYGRLRTVGPVAASFAGTTDMSGMPEPAMPAGWGYSYLDWMGAYGYALAILGALHHRAQTGQGQWIDASQCESGVFMTGVPVLDWSANGRAWSRVGNRSPWKPAAPHGAYRCAGEDRWIAIACFTDAEWRAMLDVAGRPGWGNDPRFSSLEQRMLHQDALDTAVGGWTAGQDAGALMLALQRAGVAAGLCQNAQDRCDHDPQLAHLNWLTEVTGSKIGTWPVYELPMKLSATPAHVGGPIDRGAPCYGEDNAWVLRELLGYSPAEIERLAEEGII